ncbi:MAG: hypothetical protein GX981_11400 [Tissierellia bacterium]|nr:hypothetical protein [Tissierellia bacterium]
MKNRIIFTIIILLFMLGITLIISSTTIGLNITTKQLLDTTIDGNTYLKIIESNFSIAKIIGTILTIPAVLTLVKLVK